MIVHVFRTERLNVRGKRRWEAYDEVTQKLVETGRTVPELMRKLEAKPEVSKVIRYPGLTSAAVLACTLTDLHFRNVEATGTPSK